MAITKSVSRKIFWTSLQKGLGISTEPESLEKFFQETAYKNLFQGWTENIDDADAKITKSIISIYKKEGYTVNHQENEIAAESKRKREETNNECNKIENLFRWVHGAVWEEVKRG